LKGSEVIRCKRTSVRTTGRRRHALRVPYPRAESAARVDEDRGTSGSPQCAVATRPPAAV